MATTILPLVNDPASAGQTHWTVTKLCGWLRAEKDLDLFYRTLERYLHEQGYARRIPRPVPERDAWFKLREAFGPELAALPDDPAALILRWTERRDFGLFGSAVFSVLSVFLLFSTWIVLGFVSEQPLIDHYLGARGCGDTGSGYNYFYPGGHQA